MISTFNIYVSIACTVIFMSWALLKFFVITYNITSQKTYELNKNICFGSLIVAPQLLSTVFCV